MAQDQLLEELNEEPPARLKSRVMEQVHTHPRRARPAQRSLWKRWGALAAALVLVVAGSTALPQLAGEEAAPQASSASLAEGTPRVDDRVVPFDMQEEEDAAVQPNLATQETASDFPRSRPWSWWWTGCPPTADMNARWPWMGTPAASPSQIGRAHV